MPSPALPQSGHITPTRRERNAHDYTSKRRRILGESTQRQGIRERTAARQDARGTSHELSDPFYSSRTDEDRMQDDGVFSWRLPQVDSASFSDEDAGSEDDSVGIESDEHTITSANDSQGDLEELAEGLALEREARPTDRSVIHQEFNLKPTGPNTERDRARLVVQATAASKMSRALWNSLQRMPHHGFGPEHFPSDYLVSKRLDQEAQLDVQYIDMCVNGCRAFTRDYEMDTACACGEARRDSQGKARSQFSYLSPVNRLRTQYANKALSRKLNYRKVRTVEPGKIQDIFDGQHFKELQGQPVTWNGQVVPDGGTYFDEPTDIALGLATDGVPPYKRSRLDVWPLLLTNYSLPPEIRMKREYQICVGMIPGTKEDVAERKLDMNSFLWPLIQDLSRLATSGVEAVRRDDDGQLVRFNMKAHLIVVSGDMPAISKLMCFKGINAKLPCRWCSMHGIQGGSLAKPKGPYYLSRRDGDDLTYNNLPMRTHAQIMEDVQEIVATKQKGRRKKLQVEKGINGPSIFCIVGSIDFVGSFSADIMHILFENIMKELLLLWEGKYKASQITQMVGDVLGAASNEDYVIPEHVWKIMNAEVARSNKFVPSQICRRISSLTTRGYWTAETYSFFMTHLGPILLKGRLGSKYYNHFLKLSEMVRMLTQIEIAEDQLNVIDVGMREWVVQFEKLYYQYDIKYLAFCTNPIHALLHVADNIRWLGPPSQYWCFSIERFGAWVKTQAISNRKKPIQFLNNRLRREEQIHQLIAMLEAPEAVIKWRNRVSSADNIDPMAADDDDDQDDRAPAASDARLYDRVNSPEVPSDRVMRALAGFFTSREWVPRQRGQPKSKHYTAPMIHKELRDILRWNGFKTSGDNGHQRVRTSKSTKEGEGRDMSWVFFQVSEDKRAHLQYGDPVWVDRPKYGEVKEFMSATWKGELLQLAIIETWDTEAWVPHASQGRGPHLLLRPRVLWQVVEADVILGVAGRIPRDDVNKLVRSTNPSALLDPRCMTKELYSYWLMQYDAECKDHLNQ